jgi:glutamate-1-semialdehyde 2,1-aminomutase
MSFLRRLSSYQKLPSKRSARLFDRAQLVIPGGVNSPVRAFKAVGGVPRFIQSAKGAEIRDVDGQVFIDYVMSWGPLLHGHAPRALLREINDAVQRGTSFGAPTELEIKLAERVRKLMPNMEMMRFTSSGTEATMTVIRVARAATKRGKIIKFAGCYHGHADAFLVQAGSGALTLGVPTSPGVPAAVAAQTLTADYNDMRSVEQLAEANPDQIAAVIVEPVAGNMGVIPPAKGFLEGLRTICDRHGMLLIFDEVISGFRMGPGGAQGVLGVKPDLTCLGKIIGGGLPVGAYGGRTDLMSLVAPAGPVYQAGTLSGNPIAMTAGLWSLNQLSARLYRDLDKAGAHLEAGLVDAAKGAGVAMHVNRVGSLLTPFFSSGPVIDYRTAMQAHTAAYGRFFQAMLVRGVYPPPSQFEAWFLSTAHTERLIDRTIAAARKAFAEV